MQVELARSFLMLANWIENAGRGLEEVLNLGLARKAFESASEVDPDQQKSIQMIDLEIVRVTSGRLREQ